MIRQAVRDVALYAVPALLGKGLAIILIPLYTRYLSPEEYGVLDIFLVVYAFVALVLPLEVGQGMVRHFADTDDKDERRQYFSTAFWFTGGVFFLFCVLAISNAEQLLPVILVDTSYSEAARIILAGMFFNAMAYLVLDQLRFSLRPVAYAAVSLTIAGTTILLVVALIVNKGLGLLGYAWAYCCANAVGLLIGLMLSYSDIRVQLSFSNKRLKAMLLFSAPLVFSALAVYGNNYIDRWMVTYFLGLEQLGIYGAAFRISTGVFILLLPLQMALTPLVYQMHSEPGTPQQLATILDVVVVALIAGILIFGALIHEIYDLLVGREFQTGAMLVPWLALAVAFMNLYIFAPGMSLAKRTGIIAGINIVVVVVNVLLNLILIPYFGLLGAAWATLLSGFMLIAIYMLASHKFYPLPYRYRSYVVTALLLFLVLFAGLYFSPPLEVRLGTALAGVVCLLMYFRLSIQRIIRF